MQKNGYSIVQFQGMTEYRYGNVSKCILPPKIFHPLKKQTNKKTGNNSYL